MDSSLPPSLLSQLNSPNSLFLLAVSGAKLNSKKLRRGDVAEAGLGDDADSDISGSSSTAEPRKHTRARPKRCCAPPLLPRAPTVAAVTVVADGELIDGIVVLIDSAATKCQCEVAQVAPDVLLASQMPLEESISICTL